MMHAPAWRALIFWGAGAGPEVRMATEKEANVVYAAGLVQGIVLVTFPAASTIFTDPVSTTMRQVGDRADAAAAGCCLRRRLSVRTSLRGGLRL
jgi:hypothetical protein